MPDTEIQFITKISESNIHESLAKVEHPEYNKTLDSLQNKQCNQLQNQQQQNECNTAELLHQQQQRYLQHHTNQQPHLSQPYSQQPQMQPLYQFQQNQPIQPHFQYANYPQTSQYHNLHIDERRELSTTPNQQNPQTIEVQLADVKHLHQQEHESVPDVEDDISREQISTSVSVSSLMLSVDRCTTEELNIEPQNLSQISMDQVTSTYSISSCRQEMSNESLSELKPAVGNEVTTACLDSASRMLVERCSGISEEEITVDNYDIPPNTPEEEQGPSSLSLTDEADKTFPDIKSSKENLAEEKTSSLNMENREVDIIKDRISAMRIPDDVNRDLLKYDYEATAKVDSNFQIVNKTKKCKYIFEKKVHTVPTINGNIF